MSKCIRRESDATPPCTEQCQGCSFMEAFDLTVYLDSTPGKEARQFRTWMGCPVCRIPNDGLHREDCCIGKMEDEIDRLSGYVPPSTNAAQKAAEQRGPENNPLVIPAEAACVSVPKQPTEDMVASGVHAILRIEGEQAPTRVRVVYRAMLNARPISGSEPK